MTPINLWWCLSPNVGDALNPWLVARISGRTPVYVPMDVGLGKHVVCGSILNHADGRSMVWGAGLAALTDGVDPHADIRAVRGPLSRMRALSCGAKCPPVYGDPALLLPRYYKPVGERGRYAVGIIPHFRRAHLLRSTLGGLSHPDVRIIDVFLPVEQFVEEVWACRRIVASSLHGLIVAGAYGIPAAWADFDETPIGGDSLDTKFHDYAMSVGVEDLHFTTLADAPSALADPGVLEGLPTFLPRRDITDELMAACPFRGEQ